MPSGDSVSHIESLHVVVPNRYAPCNEIDRQSEPGVTQLDKRVGSIGLWQIDTGIQS